MGATCASPPPVAPPFRPNTGPRDGSRKSATALSPSRESASARPMVTVVLPSPAGVGVTAVTRMSRPSGRVARLRSREGSSLALYRPRTSK